MTLTAKDSATRRLSSIIGPYYDESKIEKMANPMSLWSMFKFYKTVEDVNQTFNMSMENISLQGNMPKVNQEGLPAGLMAVNTLIDELTVDNVITSQFYSHITADGVEWIGQSKLNFKNSRMSDAYSTMINLWRSDVTVENSILKNAGGPIFILNDSNRAPGETWAKPRIKIDTVSVVESYAAGTEAWYKINNATALFTQLKNMNGLFMNMKSFYQAQSTEQMDLTAFACNKTFVHSVKGAEQINIIAVVIPEPDSIMTSRSDDDLVKIEGVVSRGEEVFDINDMPIEVIKTLGSAAFVSGGQYAFMPTATSIAPAFGLAALAEDPNYSAYLQVLSAMQNVPGNFNNSSDWLSITMSASSLGVSNAPYFSIIIGDFDKI